MSMSYSNNFQEPVRSRASSQTGCGSANVSVSPLQAKIDAGRQLAIQQKRVNVIQGVSQQKSLLNRTIQARTLVKQRLVTQAVQRKVSIQGGKGAAVIPAAAKSVAKWVMKKSSVQLGGSNYIDNVHNRGFSGFRKGKSEHVGGRVFNNGAQPDSSKLPYGAGQTYQEWDINPSVAGQNRGGERIVTSSDGKVYYTGDHYANFTEFIP